MSIDGVDNILRRVVAQKAEDDAIVGDEIMEMTRGVIICIFL
jgi:hypothetical protein